MLFASHRGLLLPGRLTALRFISPHPTLSNRSNTSGRHSHTSKFIPPNSDYAARSRSIFEQQKFLSHVGAKLVDIAPGYVEIHLAFNQNLMQHHGHYHGGAIATIADVSGGFAAGTLIDMERGDTVLTVELKINFANAAKGVLGATLVSKGRVLKAGRTLMTTQADLFWRAPAAEAEKKEDMLVGSMLQTIFVLRK